MHFWHRDAVESQEFHCRDLASSGKIRWTSDGIWHPCNDSPPITQAKLEDTIESALSYFGDVQHVLYMTPNRLGRHTLELGDVEWEVALRVSECIVESVPDSAPMYVQRLDHVHPSVGRILEQLFQLRVLTPYRERPDRTST